MQTTVGERIKFLRKEKGMLQDDLAEKADISVTALSSIENGGSFRKSTLERIAQALKVPVSDLSTLPTSSFGDPWKDEAYNALRNQIETLKDDNERLWKLVERLVGPGAAAAAAKLEAALTGDSSKIVAMQIPIAA